MPQIHEFRVGEFRCRALCDGVLAYPAELITRGLTEPDQIRAAGQYDGTDAHVNVPCTALLVETPRERILLDTGAGPLAPETGHLPALLESAGIAPESIGTVVLTHGHADHIGGPMFPNARYIRGSREWQFWTDETTLDKCARNELYGLGIFDQLIGDWARKYLPPLTSRLELVESEREIAPGVLLPAPGHTPGHLAVVIESGGEQCLYIGDAFALPIQAEFPEWTLPFDLDKVQAVATRCAILDRAAADQMLVFGYHCPYPPLGRIEPRGSTWRWVAA